jgi:hypothetical protein
MPASTISGVSSTSVFGGFISSSFESSLHCAASAPQDSRLRLAQQIGQLRDVRSNPPRLVFGEQLGRRASAGLFLVIKIAELLAAAVLHDKGGARLLD